MSEIEEKPKAELHIYTPQDSQERYNVRFFRLLEPKHQDLMDHTFGMAVVLDALSKCMELGGPIIEIGTRLGGSALCFMEVLRKFDKDNWIITVDPYGSLPYETRANPGISVNSSYDEDMYRRAMYELSRFAYENNLNHMHFKTTSFYFMQQYDKFQMFKDGQRTLLEDPCFVYLDGHHDCKIAEIDFFMKKLRPEGCIIIDDTEHLRKDLEDNFGEEYQVIHIPGKRSVVMHKETDTFLKNIAAYKEYSDS